MLGQRHCARDLTSAASVPAAAPWLDDAFDESGKLRKRDKASHFLRFGSCQALPPGGSTAGGSVPGRALTDLS